MNYHKILCYRNNKIVWTVECWLDENKFIEQLKEGILKFPSKDDVHDYEIIYLKNFDKIVIKDFYDILEGDPFYEKI